MRKMEFFLLLLPVACGSVRGFSKIPAIDQAKTNQPGALPWAELQRALSQYKAAGSRQNPGLPDITRTLCDIAWYPSRHLAKGNTERTSLSQTDIRDGSLLVRQRYLGTLNPPLYAELMRWNCEGLLERSTEVMQALSRARLASVKGQICSPQCSSSAVL